MTHVRNAEAFSRLVDFCTGYGGAYNPGRPNLQINALMDTKSKAADSLSKVMAAKTEYDNQVNYRKQRFDQLSTLAARVMRILEASGTSREKRADARAYVHRITGSMPKATPVVGAATEPASGAIKKTPSQRQMSYASRADSFANLLSTVSTEPLYITNEEALDLAGLKRELDELKAANARVSLAQVAWSNARIDRNGVLYGQNQSMYRTGQAVKKYIRAIYGPSSEQYAQVKTVVFSKPI